MNAYHKLNEAFVQKLFSRLEQKSFSQTHKEILLELIYENLQSIAEDGYESAILDDIAQKVHAMNQAAIEDLSVMDQDFVNEMVRNIAKKFGFSDEEVDDIDYKSFTDDFEKRFKEQHEKEEQAYQKEKQATKVLHTNKDFIKFINH